MDIRKPRIRPCNTCDTLSLRPVQSSVINVTSTNNYQCAVSDSIQIFVSLPFTARAAITDTAICMNEKLVLHVEPRNLIISWSPADKVSTPDRYDPEVSPRQSTIFRALLTDSIGCFSSEASIDVTVKSLPEVNIGPINSSHTLASLSCNRGIAIMPVIIHGLRPTH